MISEQYHLINIGFWTPDREVEKRIENPWIRKMVSLSEEFFSCFSSQMCKKKIDPLTNNSIIFVRLIKESEKEGWRTTALRILSFVAGFGIVILGIKLAYRWIYNIQLPFIDKVDYLKQNIHSITKQIEDFQEQLMLGTIEKMTELQRSFQIAMHNREKEIQEQKIKEAKEKERIIQTYEEREKFNQNKFKQAMEEDRSETRLRMTKIEEEINNLREAGQNLGSENRKLSQENKILKQKMAILLRSHDVEFEDLELKFTKKKPVTDKPR